MYPWVIYCDLTLARTWQLVSKEILIVKHKFNIIVEQGGRTSLTPFTACNSGVPFVSSGWQMLIKMPSLASSDLMYCLILNFSVCKMGTDTYFKVAVHNIAILMQL